MVIPVYYSNSLLLPRNMKGKTKTVKTGDLRMVAGCVVLPSTVHREPNPDVLLETVLWRANVLYQSRCCFIMRPATKLAYTK